jgi:hypothetical protein
MEQIIWGYRVYIITDRSRVASVQMVILISTEFQHVTANIHYYVYSGVTSNAWWNTKPNRGM